MRSVTRLLIVCCIFSAPLAAGAGDFQSLLDRGRIFDLRRALDSAGSNADIGLYRGIVACRFGHETEGIEILRGVLAMNPEASQAATIHKELAEAYERTGRYKEAVEAWTEWLKLAPENDPDREENTNTQALLSAVADVPPQTVEFKAVPVPASFRAVWNKLGSRNVPVEIGGVAGQWIFDTGADETTVSESEAKRMGLVPREATAWVSGATGQRNTLKVAVAKDLVFGPATVHNVILLVLPDKSLAISPLNYQITGILGIPVLRALAVVGIEANGAVRAGTQYARTANTQPNMFFEGDDPIVDANPGAHRVQLFLDTGANDSAFYPSFRSALSTVQLRNLKHRTEQQAGAGGTISRGVVTIPHLRIEIGGKEEILRNQSLQVSPPDRSHRFRDGVIGMDALAKGYLLDFRTMRLELD